VFLCYFLLDLPYAGKAFAPSFTGCKDAKSLREALSLRDDFFWVTSMGIHKEDIIIATGV
jgi:hypothetical protein